MKEPDYKIYLDNGIHVINNKGKRIYFEDYESQSELAKAIDKDNQ